MKSVHLLSLCFGMIHATSRPIIGIFAHPTNIGEVIVASYVKWIESAGGQVVPILLKKF